MSHDMNHPLAREAQASASLDGDTHYADDATIARMADLEDRIAGMKTRIHDQANDLAARDMILNNLAGTLKVQHIADIPAALDDLTHALATRAMTAQAPAGKPALILIDSSDLIELEMLGADDDAQAMAMSNIELGHAARVLVVRVIGEAARRVEWKEAA